MSRERAQWWLCRRLAIHFPYVQMGKIDSLDLFGPTEMMLFALYEANVGRWKHVLDVGANLGLHSVLLERYGYSVNAFEPDIGHLAHLRHNVLANDCKRVTVHPVAFHTENGRRRFVRVLNNLTGNHLEGYKDSYGPREFTVVDTVDCRSWWPRADFAKLDCEGNEAELVCTLTEQDLDHLDLVMEVRNSENAGRIYEHISELGVPMWSQKIDWKRVTKLDDMPRLNREGSLFVGHRGPWA